MSPTFPELTTYSLSDPSAPKIPIHNPATGALLTTVQGGSISSTSTAIEAAHKAYQSDWRWRSPSERSALLLKCADELDKHQEELAELLCLENGKPYQDALITDVAFLRDIFRYFGALVDKLPSEFYDRGSVYCQVIREPLGVVAGVSCLLDSPSTSRRDLGAVAREFTMVATNICRFYHSIGLLSTQEGKLHLPSPQVNHCLHFPTPLSFSEQDLPKSKIPNLWHLLEFKSDFNRQYDNHQARRASSSDSHAHRGDPANRPSTQRRASRTWSRA